MSRCELPVTRMAGYRLEEAWRERERAERAREEREREKETRRESETMREKDH